MVSYPQTFPIDAATVLVSAARNGFAPDGEHGDLACCILAGWNVEGYGLSVWKPHTDPGLYKGKAGKAKQAPAVPKGEQPRMKALAKLLEPATVVTKEGVAAPNVAALPWGQIVALIAALLQQWLAK